MDQLGRFSILFKALSDYRKDNESEIMDTAIEASRTVMEGNELVRNFSFPDTDQGYITYTRS